MQMVPLNQHVIGLKAGPNWRDFGESALHLIGAGFLFDRIPDLKFHVHCCGISRMTATLKTKILSKPHGGAPHRVIMLFFHKPKILSDN